MTESQLIIYKMDSYEQVRRDSLVKRIKDDFKSVAYFPELQMYDLQHLNSSKSAAGVRWAILKTMASKGV